MSEGCQLLFSKSPERSKRLHRKPLIEQLKKTLELGENYPIAHAWLGYAYAAKGQYPEAISAYKEAIKRGDDTTSNQIFLGYALAMSGKGSEAREILNKLQTAKEYVSSAELAILYVGLGEKEQALAALERAYTEHDLQLQYLSVDPSFEGLRGDPRFQDLVRRVGLPR